ncbi:hypothetical protein CHUV0807_2228 [Cardiobacterium hominis]|uniref:Uncharacterized protein n=1 Tax=Cardiobacterium hominis TaxID=2718 RepID=A0A1C3H6K9_9GAMM|nr:hypothetical protein CHUV0807_2228 [Cardiobacterium hominis]
MNTPRRYWIAAKRDKSWIPGLPPSGIKAGFLDYRQAG